MDKKLTIALVGNPNSGKTTLFNALTGSNQYVGNWPGVTVEKKEGRLKGHADTIVVDLPGIYSLSPYTEEEVIARDYLLTGEADLILNIIDGTNLERNLYLSTQLEELGVPMVLAVNMADVLKKSDDKIDYTALAEKFGAPVYSISAAKGEGVSQLIEGVRAHAAKKQAVMLPELFNNEIEKAIAELRSQLPSGITEQQKRWYAIKLLERDARVLKQFSLSSEQQAKCEGLTAEIEASADDDIESILSNQRYEYLGSLLKGVFTRTPNKKLSTSDKIDRVMTNPILSLPIFVAVMFLVYFLSVSAKGIGTRGTDWANDGLFGDGYHLFGMGNSQYEEAITDYAAKNVWTEELKLQLSKANEAGVIGAKAVMEAVNEEDFSAFEENYGFYADSIEQAGYPIKEAVDSALESEDKPAPENYGTWVPGIPVLVEQGLDAVNTAPWLKSLVLDGVVAGVGAVLGFVPQMIVLFLLLAFLEGCGYMARIAFILDRIFRRFGLSGKSFIPMLIGTGCSVPGIMASRTIENESDRRMTVITTSFMPCSAKLPIIAMITTALFGGNWWIAPSTYFLGMAAIIISGLMLKKTTPFAGDPAPFVMELPAYRLPRISYILSSMWERVSSFIKRAGTVIFLSSIIIWAGSHFGFGENGFGFDLDMEIEQSILGIIGNAVKFIFAPLGFGEIRATIATVMGLVAKEEVVAVFGVLDFTGMTPLAGYAFLAFNLLCAPCFAAMGAIKREMNSAKWTIFAIGYQCVLAYAVSLIIYQLGLAFTGSMNILGLLVALVLLAGICFQLFRPSPKLDKLKGRAA